MSRVCIIGLDCLTPQLLFDQYLKVLPNFKNLLENSIWGPLKSTIPPITIPAWASMVTGTPPGALGSYGFRTRKDYSYDRRKLPSSLGIPPPTLWQLTSQAGLSNRIITVPQTYPARPLKGELIAGFPIANEKGPTAHPRSLAESLKEDFPNFRVDVPDFRNRPPEELLAQIHTMTNARFELAEHWIRKNDWALFMMVEMGPDRLHHAFWDFAQEEHPDFIPNHPLRFAIRDYYILLDRWVGKLMSLLSPNDLLMVVSDHGAQTMQGGLALNQWLVDNGYLTLLDSHPKEGPLQVHQVDWPKTKAWADGGYVGRIYFNLRNREPQGWLSPQEAKTLHEELRTRLATLHDLQNNPLKVETLSTTEAYGSAPKGIPPDLTVMVNDLGYRVLGSVGHSTWLSSQNDTGRDGANHAHQGIFVGYGLGQAKGQRKGLSLFDIAPTALGHLGLTIPSYMIGKEIN